MTLLFFSVKDEDTQLASPFTQPLSASMVRMKEIQSKEKAHPKGTSKILAKARKRALEEESKKEPVSTRDLSDRGDKVHD